MTYATIMVHLGLDESNAGILQIAVELAERFHSRVVGIAAGRAIQDVYCEGYMSGDLIEEELGRVEKRIGFVEAEFRSALHGRNNVIEWRSRIMFGQSIDYLSCEARCADLVLTGTGAGEMARPSEVGELVLEAGRPVLVVPPTAGSMSLQKVVVCWKGTREARRAISNALPVLKQAAHIDVVEVAAKDDVKASEGRLEDVLAWLKAHGVSAVATTSASRNDDAADLQDLCRGADLIVAGAYGHSRLREWVLGGVTRDILVRDDSCSLLTH